MRPIFKSTALNKTFQEKGFVSFPLLDRDEVKALKDLYAQLALPDELGHGYIVGMNSTFFDRRKAMQEALMALIREKVEGVMVNRELYTATFMTKLSSDQNYVPPHQDWTYTENEEEDPSFMCWITLDDVEKANGALGFIPGSHAKTDYVRAFPFPLAPTPVELYKLQLMDLVEIIEMWAGDIAFFDNRTIHASYPNLSSVNRLAIGMSAYPRDRKLITYTLTPGKDFKEVVKWEVDPDFFLRYNNPELLKMFKSGKSLEGDYRKLNASRYDCHTEWSLEQTRAHFALGDLVDRTVLNLDVGCD